MFLCPQGDGAREHSVEVDAGRVAEIGARIGRGTPAAGGRATARGIAIRPARHTFGELATLQLHTTYKPRCWLISELANLCLKSRLCAVAHSHARA